MNYDHIEISEEEGVNDNSAYHHFNERDNYISDQSEEEITVPEEKYLDDFEEYVVDSQSSTYSSKPLKKTNYYDSTESSRAKKIPGGKTRRRKRKSIRKRESVVFSFLPRIPRTMTKKRRRNRKTRKGRK